MFAVAIIVTPLSAIAQVPQTSLQQESTNPHTGLTRNQQIKFKQLSDNTIEQPITYVDSPFMAHLFSGSSLG